MGVKGNGWRREGREREREGGMVGQRDGEEEGGKMER